MTISTHTYYRNIYHRVLYPRIRSNGRIRLVLLERLEWRPWENVLHLTTAKLRPCLGDWGPDGPHSLSQQRRGVEKCMRGCATCLYSCACTCWGLRGGFYFAFFEPVNFWTVLFSKEYFSEEKTGACEVVDARCVLWCLCLPKTMWVCELIWIW